MCFINHVDETDELRTLTKFAVSAKSEREAREVAKAYRPFAKRSAEEDYDAEFDLFQITVHVIPLKDYVAGLKSSGKAALRELAFAEKYAFVQKGAKVYWNDPDNGECSGPHIVEGVEGAIDEDTTVGLDDGTEVPVTELEPRK
jgi:hypothetical protein